MKTCYVCGEEKVLEEFDSGRNRCKSCRRQLHRENWSRKTPEQRAKHLRQVAEYQRTPAGVAKNRRAQLKHRYRITVEQYDEMLAKQGGVCQICQSDNPGPRVRNFTVDHDHITGDIRGLLCVQCNYKLGWFENVGPYRVLAYLEGEIR